MMKLIVRTQSNDELSFNIKAQTVVEATQIWESFDTFSDMRKWGFRLVDVRW